MRIVVLFTIPSTDLCHLQGGSLHAHHVSHITHMSVAGCSAVSLGKGALVVSSADMWGCKSNGVVLVCAWATHGIFAYFTQAFQLSMQSAEWPKTIQVGFYEIHAELRRPHSGQWDRRSNG